MSRDIETLRDTARQDVENIRTSHELARKNGENIRTLAHIAEMHEHRLTDLEGPNPST